MNKEERARYDGCCCHHKSRHGSLRVFSVISRCISSACKPEPPWSPSLSQYHHFTPFNPVSIHALLLNTMDFKRQQRAA
jgi:hypothetical protein